MKNVTQFILLCGLAVNLSHAGVAMKGGIPQKGTASVEVLRTVALPQASLPIQDRLNRILRSKGLLEEKIIGGEPAGPTEFPWQVALVLTGYEPREGRFCGGSVIAPQWVLTAAHCVDNETTSEMLYVFYGSVDLRSRGNSEPVDRIDIHEGWDEATKDNDIALLHLASPVKVKAISLLESAQEDALIKPAIQATVTGWGRTSPDGPSTLVLRKVRVPLVKREVCTQAAYYGSRITQNMLCYGEKSKDSCQGDSGGPLVLPKSGGFVLGGIVSWGDGCAVEKKPGIYTRVTRYADWITGRTKPM